MTISNSEHIDNLEDRTRFLTELEATFAGSGEAASGIRANYCQLRTDVDLDYREEATTWPEPCPWIVNG